LQDRLDAALASGNVQEITVAQADGRELIAELNLVSDLDKFTQSYDAPVLSADEFAQQNASIATREMSLQVATEQANELIKAIELFSKSGNSFADPIGVAKAIANLRDAMAKPEAGALQSRTTALSKMVDADPRFVAASEQRAQASDVALANAIANAGEDAAMIDSFLRDYIGEHLTDENIGGVVNVQDTLGAALAAPPSEHTVDVVKQTYADIETLGLTEDFQRFTELAKRSAKIPTVSTAENGIAITIANEDLLLGARGDLLVLRNASGSAPHLALDLVGNLMVQGGAASACWPYPIPAETIQFRWLSNSSPQKVSSRLFGHNAPSASMMPI
jgi:hypothetical protein